MIKLQHLLREITVTGYRGDKIKTDINKFDRDLLFFTKDIQVAKAFGGNVTKAKITLNNPFLIKHAGSWEDVPVSELFDPKTVYEIVKFTFGPTTYKPLEDYYSEEYGREPITIDSVAAYLHKHSEYDGIIADNIDEGPLRMRTTIYIVFNKKSIQLIP